MKKYCITLLSLLGIVLATSCNENKVQSKNHLLTIDLRKTPSTKTVYLQDIAEVEYIPLGNDSDFLSSVRFMSVTENYIWTRGGENAREILRFNRKGDEVCKFSNYGQGPGEYLYISNQTIDENKKESLV